MIEPNEEDFRRGAFSQSIQRQFEQFEPDPLKRLDLIFGFCGGMIGQMVKPESIPFIADKLAAHIKYLSPQWGKV